MSRPWTAIIVNAEQKKGAFKIFTAHNDTMRAEEEFRERFPDEMLVALVPGIHNSTHLCNMNVTN